MEAAGVDVIQFDEPGLNVFLDEVTGWGAPALERAAAGFSCKTAVHMCYGCEVETNIAWKGTLGARWRRYEKTFPAINASAIGQVSVEAVSSKAPIDLIGLLPDKEIAATIADARTYADAERLQLCTNCGMAPVARDVAVGKLRALSANAALLRRRDVV